MRAFVVSDIQKSNPYKHPITPEGCDLLIFDADPVASWKRSQAAPASIQNQSSTR
jgi:hypothetical protein